MLRSPLTKSGAPLIFLLMPIVISIIPNTTILVLAEESMSGSRVDYRLMYLFLVVTRETRSIFQKGRRRNRKYSRVSASWQPTILILHFLVFLTALAQSSTIL